MTDGEELSTRLAQVARALQHEAGVQHTLDEVVRQATEVIAGCDSASVSLVHRTNGIDTQATSDSLAATADALQYECGDGPCLDTIWRHETTQVDDLARERRWPVWGARAHNELGVASMFCIRLFLQQDTLGALNLYSTRANTFTDEDVAITAVFATHATIALAAAQEQFHLSQGITHRTVIGQAEGILMERFALDDHQAFEVLRRVSQDSNTKLYDVAVELVRTRRTPGTSG